MNAQTHERTVTPATHLPALDGVRGLAILAVVAFHVAVVVSGDAPWAYRSAPPAWSWPAFAGSLGVDLFFVLSGFLVLRSWRSIRERHGDDRVRALIDFGRRRGRRLLPPYWVALAVLIVWRTPHWFSSADGWRNIGLFVSLNQFLDTELPRHVNTVTWSLTTEAHFYVALPLLAAMWIRFGWRRGLMLVVVFSIGWRVFAGGSGGSAEWIFGRIDQFAAGMAAAALVAEHQAGRSSRALRLLMQRKTAWALGTFLVALALAHGALRLQPKPLGFLVLLHPVAGIAIAGLLVRGLLHGGLKAFSNPVLRWFGLISYSLYLWHWPLLAETTAAWGDGPLVVGGALAAGLAIAVLSYLALERPFMRPAAPRPSTEEPAPTRRLVAAADRVA